MSDAVPRIERAYRMRIHPTRAQQRQLSRLLGATRFVWNWALDRRTTAYRCDGAKLNWIALSREYTVLKNTPGTAWLAELPREPFNQVLRDQERAFANFFAKRASYPKFRRRGMPSGIRFTLDQRREQIDRGTETGRWARVSLPGLGELKLRRTEELTGRLRSITLRREGQAWYASLTADGVTAEASTPAARQILGIDVGLRELVIRSDGVREPAPATLRAKLGRLRRYQRHYTRQREAAARRQGLDPTNPFPKGTRIAVSNRMRGTQRRIGTLHARIGAVRRETLHRATTAIVRTAQVIAIEDLAVKGMSRSMGRGSFRRSVANAAPGELRRQLTYKAKWAGRVLHVADRFFPSSKTCSACGTINRSLTLREKHWRCGCGAEHDRDDNAAKNLEAHARRALYESPEPSGATRMSRGSYARGESSAVAATQNIALSQHRRSVNREPTPKRCAPNRSTRVSGTRGECGA